MKWRADFGVDTTTVSTDPEYKALVERGVVAAFGNYDKSGRFVITVQMKKTDPGRWSPRHAILATHAAVESVLLRYPAAQARGIAFVNDMSAVCLGNMDSRVPREMFAAFGSKLPVRFGGLYVVNPPFFLRMMAPVIKMFMSKKVCLILSFTLVLQAHLCLDATQDPTASWGLQRLEAALRQ